MIGYIDPSKEAFASFRANDRAGPIHMLNLVRFRDKAAYPVNGGINSGHRGGEISGHCCGR